MAEGASRTVRQAQQADWEEDSLLRLHLTTLAGTEIQLPVPVSIYHTWNMLEDYLLSTCRTLAPSKRLDVNSPCSMRILRWRCKTLCKKNYGIPITSVLSCTSAFGVWRTTSLFRGLIMKTVRRRFESLPPNQVFLKPRPSTRPCESATPV